MDRVQAEIPVVVMEMTMEMVTVAVTRTRIRTRIRIRTGAVIIRGRIEFSRAPVQAEVRKAAHHASCWAVWVAAA
jgi:hypothetical protein